MPMDPWLADRYARVEPRRSRPTARRAPLTWSRSSARDVDRMLRDLDRAHRRRRALHVLAVVLVLAVALVATLVALNG